MGKGKDFVAVQDFSVSLDNGKSSLNVKRGETLEFDGLNVIIRGQEGTARPLAKVIGEWIIPATQKITRVKRTPAVPSRNATAGRIIEFSDFSSDPANAVRKQQDDNIETLLKQYEAPQKTETTDDLSDARKEVRVINDDDREVRKVTAKDNTIANNSGVEIEEKDTEKRALLSQDGMVVKETSYENKEDTSNKKPPKLKVDKEAEGKIVKKTTSGKSSKQKVDVSTLPEKEIVETDIDVSETSYPSKQTTDVGSSTQAHIEKQKTRKKRTKKATKKVDKKEETVLDTNGQEASVVGKVSADKTPKDYKDGIVTKLSVGSVGDMEVGEATFSSNKAEDPEVSITSPGDNLSELINNESDIDNDLNIGDSIIDDIDIKDLLADVD